MSQGVAMDWDGQPLGGTDDQELDALVYGWGTAYKIARDPVTGALTAARRDDPRMVLTAAGPDSLRAQIFADYTARPVAWESRLDGIRGELERAGGAVALDRTRDNPVALFGGAEP